MSRIGKQPIILPEKVTASQDGEKITITGPLGSLQRDFLPVIEIKIADKEIILAPKKEDSNSRALWGTYASHLSNMVEGVTKGFEKKLMIEGVGYKMNIVGNKVVLNVGFSHPVELEIPAGLKVVTEKNQMTISGFDKELVGGFSAKVRSYKKVEPYKGKGIRYIDEKVRRKQGKKST